MEAKRTRGRYGCEDCGRVWTRKSDVPNACRGYVVTVVRDDTCLGGYRATSDDIDWTR